MNTDSNWSMKGTLESAAFDKTPLSIAYQRKKAYPGSEITTIESNGIYNSHEQFIVTYMSEGLKIRGLLAIPSGQKPPQGWPAIIFNHGYIPPEEYRTNERYVAYFNSFADNGYVVFKPDYRGHGQSEGQPTGAYFSDGYITDVMNAFKSIQKHPDVNAKKVGMWGHSMGGFLTLRAMVLTPEIQAGVVWGGVVSSYQDMYTLWWSNPNRERWQPSGRERNTSRTSREEITKQYGLPAPHSSFWRAISANSFVENMSGPIQIHHGTADLTVPWQISESLKKDLDKAKKPYEYYLYEGADHNLSSPAFELAIQRSIEFFDKYLK